MAMQEAPPIESIRQPPYNIDAEQAVLGGLLLDNQAWVSVSEKVSKTDFYIEKHQLIFVAISFMCEKNMPCDFLTLAEILEKRDRLNEIGGMQYLVDLVDAIPSVVNIGGYADIVREKSVLRQILTTSTDIANQVFSVKGQSPDEILDYAERQIFAIAQQGQKLAKGFNDMPSILTNVLDAVEERLNKQGLNGVSTGFKALDEKILGLQPGSLTIVAARPSMGKTSFAMNIAEHAVIKQGLTVGVFSMEMTQADLGMRLVASVGRIDQQIIRTGQLQDADWALMIKATTELNETKLFIDDTPALTPHELKNRARRLSLQQKGLDLIIIDYLQLMQVNGKENRAVEVAEISRSLKALAKELNVPVIALSQLNRTLENRPNKRPIMSDLRESGAIEQDADLILFIYRDEVYNEDSEDKGVAEIIIGKHRNGPIGTVRLTFLNTLTRFENMENPISGYDNYYTPPQNTTAGGFKPVFNT